MKFFRTIWRPTKNIYLGDFPTEPKIHVLHGTMGELSSALPWLQGKHGNRDSSAHFITDRDGTTYNLAGVAKRTWHAGVVKQPNAKARAILEKYGKNPNKYSLGYEVVIKWGEDYSQAQVQAWCDLYEYLKAKYNWQIPLSENTLVTHKDFTVHKQNLDRSRLAIIHELRNRGLWSEDTQDLQDQITNLQKMVELLTRLITLLSANKQV